MSRASSSVNDVALLVLRGAGLLLCLTFGRTKFVSLVAAISAGQSLSISGLAPLIQRAGFPLAGLLGVYVALCESVGALFVACGLMARIAALALALSMAGAFYVSLWLGEEPVRAALYFTIFAALVVTGPGRFSIDAVIRARSVIASARGSQ